MLMHAIAHINCANTIKLGKPALKVAPGSGCKSHCCAREFEPVSVLPMASLSIAVPAELSHLTPVVTELSSLLCKVALIKPWLTGRKTPTYLLTLK